MPDLQLIYENTIATTTLNDWLRSFFQENQDQMWEVYNDMLSWSIAERDIVNLIDPAAYTELIIAEFKVIPILSIKSFPIDDHSTQVWIYLGAERINASTIQSIIKQALEPANAESAQARVITSPNEESMAPPRAASQLEGKLPTGQPIKILFLAASPLDNVRIQAEEEARAIDLALRQSANRNFVIHYHGAVRTDDLQALLLRHDPDIVHFCGHGSQDDELVFVGTQGGSVKVSGTALRQLFAVLKGNIRCIVLNACYTATQAEVLAEVINCVIGIDDAVSEDAARQFATAFYQALGYARSIGDAFALGKNQIELAGLGEAESLHLLTRTDGAGTFTFATDSPNQSKPLATPPPPTTRGTMDQGQLSIQQKMGLVDALLACANVASRQTRDTIVNDLPSTIKNNIRRNDADRVDVVNIITTVINYTNGLEDLLTIIRSYEGDSIGMQAVDKLLAKYERA